jgi:hypothetical protein
MLGQGDCGVFLGSISKKFDPAFRYKILFLLDRRKLSKKPPLSNFILLLSKLISVVTTGEEFSRLSQLQLSCRTSFTR